MIGLAAILLAGGACGRKAAPPRAPTDLPTRLPSEEEARRVREDARDAIPLLPEGERGLGEEDLPPTAGEGEVPEAGATRYGYRVQVFATSDPELAEARAEEVRELFDERVYVEYEGLLYKVRVGDCPGRDEATALRRRVVGYGFEGAFIVDTQVHVE